MSGVGHCLIQTTTVATGRDEKASTFVGWKQIPGIPRNLLPGYTPMFESIFNYSQSVKANQSVGEGGLSLRNVKILTQGTTLMVRGVSGSFSMEELWLLCFHESYPVSPWIFVYGVKNSSSQAFHTQLFAAVWFYWEL